MRLDAYNNRGFLRGRPAWVECLWLAMQALFIRPPIPGSGHRRVILRLFGARIGTGVTIKPGLRVKFPWRLTVGDYCWLGEDLWIDNLADVAIGSHCCLSQDVYLCTGNHDWSAPGFDLRVAPITVCDHVWIAARAVVAPGVTVSEGSILALGSIATKTTSPWTIYAGNPAQPVKKRPELASARV
ncbi:WcaF family extracellular polysaccharide biosynthesis acetyltransferase [Hyphomicrobium sp.]|uniref:WcaF family extracellular polysaccharide biosynthesis acetyltransferase n=1 Tax=Hyphomicrobium sp. TaxID=82 RepID=UPI002D793640|nr:WcaF family extracellular polysaccharide biosynthesis acetyltransferase [Hyphomicrobium sp.]HET6389273.1 WcaF family extracellular polysaccharide biosynthesis acetyltransferase [Hyphomicrobium sp.]